MSKTATIEENKPGEFKPISKEDLKRLRREAETQLAVQSSAVNRFNNLNTTRHRVFDKAVLVRMDETLQQVGSIWLPPEARDKQQLAELYGTIVQMGVNAFAEAKREAASIGTVCDCPQVGDRVTIARYAGVMLDPKRVGGGHVRMMNDEDIIAIVEDDG